MSKIKAEPKAPEPREVKKTPIREPSKDKREPTPREKSTIKEEKKEPPTKERDDGGEKKKEKRRDKRSASVEFEGDLSSVSNSSNGSSMPVNNDVVVVEDQRGKRLFPVENRRTLSIFFPLPRIKTSQS